MLWINHTSAPWKDLPKKFGLWRQEYKTLVDFNSIVNHRKEINSKGNCCGEIIHSFDKQLPFIPSLSFLNCKKSSLISNSLMEVNAYYLSYYLVIHFSIKKIIVSNDNIKN